MVILVSLIITLTLHIFSIHYSIAIGHDQCLKGKVWLIQKNVMPSKGDYIYFKGTHIPIYEKKRLIKLVKGVNGDIVRVIPDIGTMSIMINDMPIKFKLRARVQLIENNRVIAEYPIFEKGISGRELPFMLKYGTTTIKDGYFVVGTHPASYDSRYWGILDKKDVLGRGILIF